MHTTSPQLPDPAVPTRRPPPPERPSPLLASPVAQPCGAIFRTVNYPPLFEDRRARNFGDTRTIVSNEKLQASKQSGSSVDKSGSSSLSIPTLVIWALDDIALPPGNLDGLDALVTDLTVVKVPDCGHFVPWEAPTAVNAALDAFLAAPMVVNG